MRNRQTDNHRTQGAIAVITGASSGIGKASAQLFAEEGFRVFGTSRKKHARQDGVEMLELDVCSASSVSRFAEDILARAGRVEVLVNNAGMWHLGFAEETSMEEVGSVMETNFYGVVRLIDALLPSMRERRQGRIIKVGSLAAWVGEPAEAFYSASKRALAGYTEALRHEVWPLGIHVSLVEAGVFRTGILETGEPGEHTIADYNPSRQAVRHTFQEAFRKGGDPRKVVHSILKIARARSPHFRYAVGGRARWLPDLPQSWLDYALRRAFRLHREVNRRNN